MEPDPTGKEEQCEERCNEDQKAKAFHAKLDEVCGTDFIRWQTCFRDYSIIWTQWQAKLWHGICESGNSREAETEDSPAMGPIGPIGPMGFRGSNGASPYRAST